MKALNEQLQSADWKNEKHVPVIDAPASVQAGEKFRVDAAVGKEIAHPNTTEHFIKWIKLFFLPEGATQTIELASYEFAAHGESGKGANEGPAFAHPQVSCTVSLKKSGTLHALSYCNIHGLWQSTKEITVNS